MRTVKLEGVWNNPDTGKAEVTLDGRPLSPERSLRLRNHSPDGFAWGYGDTRLAQLALAILLECTSEQQALEGYQEFKWKLAELPRTDVSAEIDVTEWCT